MPSLVVNAKDLQGYVPIIDPRRLAKPTLINGQNFLHDVDGPRSAFASMFSNYCQYSNDSRVKLTPLQVGDDIWYGTPEGLFRHDPTTGEIIVMLYITVDNIFWPWTTAECGGLYYFAQYGLGLWQYDPIANSVTKIDLAASDDTIKFVSSSYGRLLVLIINSVSDIVIWSSLDDGTDFVPSITTGAGFQTCGLAGRNALRVDGVADGFIVTTTSGLMKSTFIGTAAVFAHRLLSDQVKVFSPNAGVIIPDLGLVLCDRTGFWLSNGNAPTAWLPEMGRFFKDNQLKTMDGTKIGCLCVYYSLAMQAFWVAFAPNSHEGNFTSAYVYMVLAEQWGVFNKTSWGFFDTILPLTGVRAMNYMSFDGYMQYFVESYQSDVIPAAPFSLSTVIWRPSVEQQIRILDGVSYGYTTVHTPDYDHTFYSMLSQFGPYYWAWNVRDDQTLEDFDFSDPPLDTQVSPFYAVTNLIFYPEGSLTLEPSPFSLPKAGLASNIEVGPFRFTEQQNADETSSISGLIVGISNVTAFSSSEDWNLLVGASDWNTQDGSEDWGAGSGNPDNFDLVLNSTNDGTNPGQQGFEPLYVQQNLGSSLFYSPQGWSAIYHRLKLSATEPGQGFAFKYVDLGGSLTGRMTFNG